MRLRKFACLMMVAWATTATGCTWKRDSRDWTWWWNETKQDLKAASGTSEHLGMSSKARDIESSLNRHRP
jgi:hypothetical protein